MIRAAANESVRWRGRLLAAIAVLLTAGIGRAAEPAADRSYDPPWAYAMASRVIVVDHDPTVGDRANGAVLAAALSSLRAGDRLEIGGGRWSIDSTVRLNLRGSSGAPIFIVGRPYEMPVITRPDARQNLLNVEGDYFAIRGIELTGGSAGIRLGRSRHVWIDECEIHHTRDSAITANTANTSNLHITRNHIHHISTGGGGGTGEGMYLGANNGAHVMSRSVVALNHVHHTGGSQGDGIEVKQGSWGNWIVENRVHDTRFPCILVYGTGGRAPNIVERNVCIGSRAETMQAQGEAIIRNNLIVRGRTAFQSHDHQGKSRDLVVVHNTIVNDGPGANLENWNERQGMVFANNVVYSRRGTAVRFGRGSEGVTFAGNVVLGDVVGIDSGFVTGRGLKDFVDVSWRGASDARPTENGPLVGAGHPAHAVKEDLDGGRRSGPPTAGCLEP